jgi:hypothetical protein
MIAHPEHLRSAHLHRDPCVTVNGRPGAAAICASTPCPRQPSHTLNDGALSGRHTDLAHHSGASGRHLPCFRGSPPPCWPSRAERTCPIERPFSKEAAPCKATSEDAARRDRGSTSSTSAITVPSAAKVAGSASGSNAAHVRSVRPVAGSCVRPRSAAARPRAALPAARTARRP